MLNNFYILIKNYYSKIVENTSKYLAMSKEENKEFLDNLYSLMKN